MSHNLTAILVNGEIDGAVARELDLRPVSLTPSLTMFHVDHYFAAYWQAVRGSKDLLDVPADFAVTFPRGGVLRNMVCELTAKPAPTFAIIMTDYFGGVGHQWACVFTGSVRLTNVTTINAALQVLGVNRTPVLDEFDTIGLGKHRSSPEYLERYIELCDTLGV